MESRQPAKGVLTSRSRPQAPGASPSWAPLGASAELTSQTYDTRRVMELGYLSTPPARPRLRATGERVHAPTWSSRTLAAEDTSREETQAVTLGAHCNGVPEGMAPTANLSAPDHVCWGHSLHKEECGSKLRIEHNPSYTSALPLGFLLGFQAPSHRGSKGLCPNN